MAVPFDMRFSVDFDVVFPLGAYIVGEVVPVTEYQSQEDKAKWITWVVRGAGLRAVEAAPAKDTTSKSAAA